MKIRRFFSNNKTLEKCIYISGEEFFHLKNVTRAKVGDQIEVINGEGYLFYGKIKKITGNEAVIYIIKKRKEKKSPVKIVIAPSLLKRSAMCLMIEKLSEIGIDEIRPVISERTDEKYSKSMLEKWNRIAIQSLKVNKKLWVSQIYPPVSINDILSFSKKMSTKILLDIEGRKETNSDLIPPVISIIGPPGDFIKEEKELFIENDFSPLNINNFTLKSETAAISIGAILSRTINRIDE